MSDSSLPVVVRRTDGKLFRIVCQARSPDGPVSLVACDGPPFERVEINGRDFMHEFSDPRRETPHRWVQDIDAGCARCEGCGIYIVAALSLTKGVNATVLVGGQYINGGLHLTQPEHRKPYDPVRHGRCEKVTP